MARLTALRTASIMPDIGRTERAMTLVLREIEVQRVVAESLRGAARFDVSPMTTTSRGPRDTLDDQDSIMGGGRVLVRRGLSRGRST
jgi:hypothetical protein